MKKFFPIYPILLGITWVLVTYVRNIVMLPSPSVMVVPLLVVTGIIAAIWAITQLIVKDWKKSALIVTVISGFTVLHGFIRDYTETEGIAVAPVWLAFIVIGIAVILKMTRETGRLHLTVVVNVLCIAVLLVSLSSFVIASNNIQAGSDLRSEEVSVNATPETLPDIYYIIPDTYTSGYVLEEYLDYDNSSFYNFLSNRGFKVYPNSYANYHHSLLSISSILNIRYWTDEEMGTGGSASKYLGERLFQNPVGNTVKEAGYTYVHLGSWWGFTSRNVKADITPSFSSLSELSFTLYRTTIWYDLADSLFDMGGNAILREAHLNQLNNLVEVSKMEEPTYTFCHLILPHPPFLFEADGSHTYGWKLPADEWRSMYLAQLEYTTGKLEETIDQILANSKTTPIIILCSDEGYAGPEWRDYKICNSGVDTILEDRPDLVIKRHGNLFAVLNPYGDLSELKSPVNTFRVVFNGLFDSNLELLPDKYYLKALGEYESKLIEDTSLLMEASK